MWDGDFAGSVNVRWQSGTTGLLAYVLGHVGYAVVTERQGRGYVTAALAGILPFAWDTGLPFVELTTTLDNLASQKVITNNGVWWWRSSLLPPNKVRTGCFVGEFHPPNSLAKNPLLARVAALSAAVHEHR